jgi:hypothetical protein
MKVSFITYSKNITLIGLLTLSLAIGAALFLTRTTSASVALLGITIIGITLVPSVLYFMWPHSNNTIPFFPLVGIFYFFFFGLPIFLA